MTMPTFREKFKPYVCVGDSITLEHEGITYEATVHYDDTLDAPDQRQCGFWPSLNPDDAGFIGENKTQSDLKKATAEAQAIYDAWKKGEWFYCGIVISAHVEIESTSEYVKLTDHAASLWGIECNYPDGKNEYLSSIANELLGEAIDRTQEAINSLQAINR